MSGYATGPYRNPQAEAYAEGGETHTRYAILACFTDEVHEQWAPSWVEAFEQWLVAEDYTGYKAFAGFPARDGDYYCFVLADDDVRENVIVAPYAALEDVS